MLNHANLVLLVQLHVWFPSMHTHHVWVLLEKILSLDFWLLENLGCYNKPRRFASSSAGQAGFGIGGMPVNLTLQLTRRENDS